MAWALIVFFLSGSHVSDKGTCNPALNCPAQIVVVPGFDTRDMCEDAAGAIGGERHVCVKTRGIH